MLLMTELRLLHLNNLVQYFGELGEEVMVFRNNAIIPNEISQLEPSFIEISPDPPCIKYSPESLI